MGNSLEAKIFDFFQTEILENRFIAKPECCQIFRRKGYYSKDREKNIFFDVSIEIYLPGTTQYSVLWLIECKNYSRSVPVDDSEEFFAKVQQISGANVKGVIATTSFFQEGTINFSKSKGIGLLRYFRESEIKWVLHRSVPIVAATNSENSAEIHRGLTSSSFRSRRFSMFCFYGRTYTNSIRTFFRTLAQDCLDRASLARIKPKGSPRKRLIDFVSKDEIERISLNVLKECRYMDGPVRLSKICTKITRDRGLVLSRDLAPTEDDSKVEILGRIGFDPLQISIYTQREKNCGRERFTLAHELGHFFLNHSRYLKAEYCESNDLEIGEDDELNGLRSLEWQANYFASCLLLPRRVLTNECLALLRSRGLKNRGYGPLFLDEQHCNKSEYYLITSQIKSTFNVSRIALKLRLEDVGLLYDVTGRNVSDYLKKIRRTEPPLQVVQSRAS